jgi:hypothetical protein
MNQIYQLFYDFFIYIGLYGVRYIWGASVLSGMVLKYIIQTQLEIVVKWY